MIRMCSKTTLNPHNPHILSWPCTLYLTANMEGMDAPNFKTLAFHTISAFPCQQLYKRLNPHSFKTKKMKTGSMYYCNTKDPLWKLIRDNEHYKRVKSKKRKSRPKVIRIFKVLQRMTCLFQDTCLVKQNVDLFSGMLLDQKMLLSQNIFCL